MPVAIEESKGVSDSSAKARLREFRRVTANVVGELRSQEIRDTYAAMTLTEVLDQHLKELVGDGRVPSRKTRLKKMHDEFNANIQAIKDTPPSSFRTPDPAQDVNTAPDGS